MLSFYLCPKVITLSGFHCNISLDKCHVHFLFNLLVLTKNHLVLFQLYVYGGKTVFLQSIII